MMNKLIMQPPGWFGSDRTRDWPGPQPNLLHRQRASCQF